jgi:hypothetical protein
VAACERGDPVGRGAIAGSRLGRARGAHALTFVTGGNDLDELRILPGVQIWERILLSDGSPARLVTSPAEGLPV